MSGRALGSTRNLSLARKNQKLAKVSMGKSKQQTWRRKILTLVWSTSPRPRAKILVKISLESYLTLALFLYIQLTLSHITHLILKFAKKHSLVLTDLFRKLGTACKTFFKQSLSVDYRYLCTRCRRVAKVNKLLEGPEPCTNQGKQ